MSDSDLQFAIKRPKSSGSQSNAIERLILDGNASCLQRPGLSAGNALLYSFRRFFPLVEAMPSDATSAELTVRETSFSEQMWLIGRAYAASPQRYRYVPLDDKTKDMVKPNENYIGTEGYESFFADIARIMLREECHDKDNPIAYLRGKQVDLSKYFQSKEEGHLSFESVAGAYETLGRIGDFRSAVEKLQGSTYALGKWSVERASKTISCSDDELDLVCEVTKCVIWFALLLNAARRLRDAAIIVKSAGCPKSEMEKWERAVLTGRQSLNLSFSSKFLHFHLPNLFFIYDSISEQNLNKTMKPLGGTKQALSSIAGEIEKELSEMAGIASDTLADGRIYAYLVHAVREYALASRLCTHDHKAALQCACPDTPGNRSITRRVDFLVTNAFVTSVLKV